MTHKCDSRGEECNDVIFTFCIREGKGSIREGPTYESGIAMWHCAEEKEIPPATVVSKLEYLHEVDSYLHMMFDVETTSLGSSYY